MNHPAGAVDVVYGNWPLMKWSESSYSRIWKRCYKDRLGRGVVGPGEYGVRGCHIYQYGRASVRPLGQHCHT